jgi:hypothetical protein
MIIKMKDKFYTETLFKLVILSGCTLGVYNMYFFYRNHLLLNDSPDEFSMGSLVKGILYPLFCYKLLVRADEKRGKLRFMPEILTIIIFLFVFSGGFFSGYAKYLSFFTFIPLVAVNYLFQKAGKD